MDIPCRNSRSSPNRESVIVQVVSETVIEAKVEEAVAVDRPEVVGGKKSEE